jgi:hypothetical protein
MLQVRLDGVDGNVEPLRDLPVRHPLGRQAGDPRLGTREGIGILGMASLTAAHNLELFSGTSCDDFRSN